MWNTDGGGFNDGGFVGAGADGSSPSQASQSKKERTAQNLFATTIKKILECGNDGMTVAGLQIKMVTIVGIIREIDKSSTKISYMIDDSTGCIEATQYMTDIDELKDHQPSVMEMTYCRLIGSIRTQQGKKLLIAFRIEPLKDMNSLTKHIVEVMHSEFKLKRIQSERELGAPAASFSADTSGRPMTSNNAVHGSSNAGAMGLSNSQRMVFQLIQQCVDDCGIGRKDIYNNLRGKVQPNEIDKVIEFLSSEGHIYTTVDDDTFRTTDG